MIYEKIKMMMIPKQTITNLIICLWGLLVIVLAGIVPNFVSLASLSRAMSSVQFQIDEQEKLYPVYQLLKKNTQEKVSTILPFPAGERLSRKLIDLFPAAFNDMTKKAGMDVVSISPDLNSLSDSSRFIIVNAVVRGEFFDFRKLLISLGEVPYSERVEEIEIRQNEDFMEFRMKIRLAIS